MFPFLKKEDPKIRFTFDQQHRDLYVSWDDEIVLYKLMRGEKDVNPEAIKYMAAHLMIDEKGQSIPEDKALKILGKLNRVDQKEIFAELVKTINESIIPNSTGGDSTLPGAVGQEPETPPNGSTS